MDDFSTNLDCAFVAHFLFQTDFLDLTDRALHNVFETRQKSSNSSLDADEWLDALKGLINLTQAEKVGRFNGTYPLINATSNILMLEANITELVERNATMEEIVSWVQNSTTSRWGFNISQSDVEYLAKHWFGNASAAVGFNTPSGELSAWTNSAYPNLTMHVDKILAEATEYYKEFGNTTVPNLSELMREFLEAEGHFDRGVVRREMEYIISDAANSLPNAELNASDIITSNFKFLDGIAAIFNDSVPELEFANNMAVSQMVVMKSVLTQVRESSVVHI